MNRIAVLSEDFAAPWDEGIKKFAWSVGTALGVGAKVVMLNIDRSGVGESGPTRVAGTRTFASAALRRELGRFDPDFVLYVPSPSMTLASFVRAFNLRRLAPRASHAMVALIPRRHAKWLRPVLRGLTPDVVLVPSYASLLHLHEHALRGGLVPVGVDTGVFKPATSGERDALREKHGVASGAYVYLHVGHLSPKRNLEALAALKDDGTEVIVVGSTSTPADAALSRRLEQRGVRVIREVVPVEEYYRLCDCYIFPVHDSEGCVEIPLSVVEALASGTPVLATPFGGLRDFLQPGEDLRYWESEEELLGAAAALRNTGRPEARDMEAFSWEAVSRRILDAVES
jgi:glycosyltransferase involved in cell wall biosynthesis